MRKLRLLPTGELHRNQIHIILPVPPLAFHVGFLPGLSSLLFPKRPSDSNLLVSFSQHSSDTLFQSFYTLPCQTFALLLIAMNETASCNDAALRPAVQGCRQDFDFTLGFEQYILTLVPAVIFILVAPFRIASLRKTPPRVRGQTLHLAKLVNLIEHA